MTRHQRRKRARLMAEARERSAIVRNNLSAPADRFTPRGRLVSGVYVGEGGRARGMGVVPMTHKSVPIPGQRLDKRDPRVRTELPYCFFDNRAKHTKVRD